MGDVRCAKCGEPWDYYGVRHGDMEEEEASRFLAGEGCPCCAFGAHCPSCDGSGRVPHWTVPACSTCNDRGYVLAWSPRSDVPNRTYRAGRFYMGYRPGVRALSDPGFDDPTTLGQRTFPEKGQTWQSADGYVENWWVICPDCHANSDFQVCEKCGGSGKLKPDPNLELIAAKSEIDNSDEDAFDILERRRL